MRRRLLGIRKNESVGAKPDSSYIETQQHSGLRNTMSFSHYSPHVNRPGRWQLCSLQLLKDPGHSLQNCYHERLCNCLSSHISTSCSSPTGNSCLHHMCLVHAVGQKRRSMELTCLLIEVRVNPHPGPSQTDFSLFISQ